MELIENKIYRIKETGPERLKGKDFRFEFEVKEDLFDLIDRGNWAARNAVTIDYPGLIAKCGIDVCKNGFCYGKIGSLGYVVLMEDLEEIGANQ